MDTQVAVLLTNKVQNELLTLLKNKGVRCIGIDDFDEKSTKDILKNCEKIVLPFPTLSVKLTFLPDGAFLSDFLSPHHVVIGGMIGKDIREDLDRAQIKLCDYFENEAYVLKNAYLTSQGALRLLLESTGSFVVGKKVLITGFGRIGKSLATILKNLGMKVFVAVRREEAAAEAAACGFDVFNFNSLSGTLFYYDYVFNTVPARIFTYRDVSHLGDNTVYFELASSPLGVDEKFFSLLGKNYVPGGALPGKFYPQAVAKNISDFILCTGR